MKNHACNIIARHLDKAGLDHPPTQFKCLQICAFTGQEIESGYSKKILSSNFTDWDSLKFNSDYISIDVALCIKPTLPIGDSFSELRKYSFFASEQNLVLLNSENLLKYLLSDKEVPFVFCIGSLQSSKAQKHTSFKAEVNYNNDIFSVQTEIGPVLFDRIKAIEILPIIQNWYTVTDKTRGMATELTHFTKQEILTGSTNFAKIEAYGVDAYMAENDILKGYRNDLWFHLLVKGLTKQ